MTDFAPSMPEGDGLVPGWLERLAAVGWRLLATIALGLVLLWIAVLLGTVTASILVAAIVAATFAPFVLALRDRGWSRIKAAAAVFVGAMLVILATLVDHRPGLPAGDPVGCRGHHHAGSRAQGPPGQRQHPARGGQRDRPRDTGHPGVDLGLRHPRSPAASGRSRPSGSWRPS